MAAEESKIKNVVIVASDDSGSSKKEEEKKVETGIDLGLSLDKLSLGPQKKLLVIPLGGLIVHRAHVRDKFKLPKNRRPDLSYGNFMVYKRPFCESFLKFCFERFEVGLWSSAMEHNIETVLTQLIGELKNKFLFSWDQNQCTKTRFTCFGSKHKPLFLKELKYIWEKKYSSGEYSSSNTLLITDPEKALLNPPNTAIFPKEYNVKKKDDDFLGPNGELRAFLDGLVESKDVESYVKNHPFGEPAITPSHSQWDYYEKIISSLGKEESSDEEYWDSDCSY
ncbi:hypothetical protein L2E82_28203 [Cichorium intybus]|uniref:Uncharacterized protein n=1 Tax=Cichorium intybus TaxID=13427 RepID=A0ACB9CVK2_CICIN|nr:hypothetical protein L2E82_28203 [Cichorium intybus]